MKKEDLDALAGLYESLYSPVGSDEYLIEAPQKTPPSTDVGYRVGRGLMGALRDLPSATLGQLQGVNNPARQRQAQRGRNLQSLLSTGKVPTSTAKPAAQPPAKPAAQPPAKPAAQPPARPGAQPPARPLTAKVAPTAAAKPAGQTGDKAKDMATWAKANPTLANKPKTPNPLMRDMPGQNKAELDQLRGNAAISSISQSPSAKRILSGTARSATASEIGKASLDRSAAALEAKPPAPKVPSPSPTATSKGYSQNTPALGSSAPAVKSAGSTAASKPTTNQTATAFSSPSLARPTPSTTPIRKPGAVMASFEWGTKATLKDVADAYASIYEGKKKDQDQDGDTDFADVQIARMIASGMSRAEAIAAVRNKEYNEEFVTEDPVQDFRDMRRAKENAAGLRGSELSNSARPAGSAAQKPQPRSREFEKVLPSGGKPKPSGGGSAAMRPTGPSSPGYDTRRLGGSDLRRLSNSYEFEGSIVDEATRMRKELGKEGETATRKELAARSRAYNRSGSIDKTIAAAERGAARPYVKHKRDESDADRSKREGKQSRILTMLASSRRKSVRGEGGLRGYAAKVDGSDRDLQSARGSARSAGTLTPAEKKQIGEEYQIYEIIASYLLENNFAETVNDANAIIENMSEKWIQDILEQSAIAARAAKVVDDQRQGYHGDFDAINKLQDATSKSIGKLKRGQGPVVTPGMPVRGV